MNDWIIGCIGSLLIAGLAYWKRSLSVSGAAAAIVIGTAMYAIGSAAWFGILIAFFVSSSILSKWNQRNKQQMEGAYEKGNRRDAGQVAANGGLGLILCMADGVWPHTIWWVAFIGVMAGVTADTWATEIGSLSRTPPRLIVSGKKVPPGTSGAVSAIGLAAAAAGSLLIGGVAWLFSTTAFGADAESFGSEFFARHSDQGFALLAVALLGGSAGALADSVIGAKWQVMYACSACGRQIEKAEHCGTAAKRIRGWTRMDNDAVNLISSALGGVAAVVVAALTGVVI